MEKKTAPSRRQITFRPQRVFGRLNAGSLADRLRRYSIGGDDDAIK